MNRPASLAPILCLFAAATLLLAACGDYEIPLVRGYFISRLSSSRFTVVAPNQKVVVKPTVVAYAVDGDVVFGEVLSETTRRTEFFAIDTRNDEVHTGLDRASWTKTLTAWRVRATDMKKPRRWDRR